MNTQPSALPGPLIVLVTVNDPGVVTSGVLVIVAWLDGVGNAGFSAAVGEPVVAYPSAVNSFTL